MVVPSPTIRSADSAAAPAIGVSPAPATTTTTLPIAPPLAVNADGEDEPLIAHPSLPPSPSPDADDDERSASFEVPVAPAPIEPVAAVPDDEDDDVDPLAGFELPGVDPRWRAFVQALQKARAGTFRLGRLKSVANDVVEVCFATGHAVDEATRMAVEPEVLARLEKSFGKRLKLSVLREDAGAVSVHDAEEALRRAR